MAMIDLGVLAAPVVKGRVVLASTLVFNGKATVAFTVIERGSVSSCKMVDTVAMLESVELEDLLVTGFLNS